MSFDEWLWAHRATWKKDVETLRYIETGACLIISVQRDISVGKVNVLLLPKFVLILVIKPKEKDC